MTTQHFNVSPTHKNIHIQTDLYVFLNSLQFHFIINYQHFLILVYILLHQIYWLDSTSLCTVLVVPEKMIIGPLLPDLLVTYNFCYGR